MMLPFFTVDIDLLFTVLSRVAAAGRASLFTLTYDFNMVQSTLRTRGSPPTDASSRVLPASSAQPCTAPALPTAPRTGSHATHMVHPTPQATPEADIEVQRDHLICPIRKKVVIYYLLEAKCTKSVHR